MTSQRHAPSSTAARTLGAPGPPAGPHVSGAPPGSGRRPRRRPGPRDLRTVAGFLALYVAASVLGRMTVLEGATVSLVWPAAGISVLWLLARARRPWPWVDALALLACTWVVSFLTGAPVRTGLIGAVAAVVQAVVCAAVLARLAPAVWAARGAHQLRRLPDLWWLTLGAATGAAISAPLIELAVVIGGGPSTWQTALLWTVRNIVSILTVSTFGMALDEWWRTRRRRPDAHARRSWWTTDRRVDHLGALVLAPLVYLLWFGELSEPVVVFPLLTLTVWAGSRLPVATVVLHTTVCGVVTVGMTLAGIGPFATLPGNVTQVVVAQLFVGLVCIIGLALAMARSERLALLAELGTARDRALEQAALLGTVLDTMAEGVRVVDAQGRVLVRNPTANVLLTGRTELDHTDSTTDLAGLRRMDGTPLTDAELPYRRAMAGEEVRDMDLLVRLPGTPEPRVVTFSAQAIPEAAGGGVVTVLRDVTAARTELRRAAQVQASLLPGRVLDVPGFDLAARFVPAGSVGGDFYDWQRLPDGLVLTLADVMGKGTAAAILAATTRSVLRAQVGLRDVAGTLDAAERAMDVDLANAGAFVTMFRAYVDVVDGTVLYTDAGHGLSLIVGPDGSARRLGATGLPLGVAPGSARTSAWARLRPGDVLVTFSDGVLDALGGALDDLDRVGEAVHGAGSADDAAQAVLALVRDSHVVDDDLTVVALRRAA